MPPTDRAPSLLISTETGTSRVVIPCLPATLGRSPACTVQVEADGLDDDHAHLSAAGAGRLFVAARSPTAALYVDGVASSVAEIAPGGVFELGRSYDAGPACRCVLDYGPVVIGRAADVDVCIRDPHVSSRHAELRVSAAGGHTLVDCGSSNGTFVNGRAVRRADLAPGDVVRFGPAAERRYDGEGLSSVAPTVPLDAPRSDDGRTPVVPALPRRRTRTGDDAGSRPLVSHLVPTLARPYLIGREADSDLVLPEPSVSRRHARIELLPDGRHLLGDTRSANGTFVNGERVERRLLRAGDEIRIGPYNLRYDGRTLTAPEREVQGFRIDAADLTRDAGRARLLDGVSVTIRPNELVALVGGSGAGKSTLLKALAGAVPPTAGRVLYNGADLYATLDAFRPIIGYVPQSDIIHADLPVARALDYVARLRLPPDLSAAERRTRIDETLAEVGLTERASSLIRTLSGGQAKRVSVAVELLANPKVLLLDEPTSGLDAGLDKRLMELFRSLADEGRTVIVVTHSVLHLDLCDRVVFLAPGGRLAYDGAPREALDHFGTADFADCYTAIEREPPAPQAPTGATDASGAAPSVQPGRRLPFTAQLRVLARRNVELLARDRRNLVLLLLQAPVIGAALALVATGGAWSDRAVAAVRTQQVAFAIANVAVWFGLINAAREIAKERAIVLRERAMGVRTAPYLLAKLVPMAGLVVVQCAVLLALLAVRVGLPADGILAPPFAELLVTLSLTGLAAVAGALLISALVTKEDRAVTLVPYLLIPQFLLAGVAFEITGRARILEALTITHWGTSAVGRTVDVCGHAVPDPVCAVPGAVPYEPVVSGLVTAWGVLAAATVLLLVAAGLALRRSAARQA